MTDGKGAYGAADCAGNDPAGTAEVVTAAQACIVCDDTDSPKRSGQGGTKVCVDATGCSERQFRAWTPGPTETATSCGTCGTERPVEELTQAYSFSYELIEGRMWCRDKEACYRTWVAGSALSPEAQAAALGGTP